MNYAGMAVNIVDAQDQRRTPRDVRGPWIRPKVPSKASGRRGTRRAWKRRNAPHFVMLYREPTDVLVLHNRTIIVTPQQADILKRATIEQAWDARPGSVSPIFRTRRGALLSRHQERENEDQKS